MAAHFRLPVRAARRQADHWERFVRRFRETNGCEVPEHWRENVGRMLGCGDIREGFYEYLCGDCGTIKRVGFTCKSRLCLRCFKVAVDDWLKTAKKVLFEGVVHRQSASWPYCNCPDGPAMKILTFTSWSAKAALTRTTNGGT